MIEIRSKNFIAYNASESVWESIIKDVFTGLMLSFCVYISHWQPQCFWTFISGLMFLSYLGIKLGRLMRDKQTKFETWSEFKTWIDKQAELENHLAGNVQIVKGNRNVQAGGDVWKDKQ